VKDDGTVVMRFTSTLVNVGTGDFILTGSREFDDWIVTQQIPYTIGGTEKVSTDAEMVWGGDGHEHWHVDRVAVYWLEQLDENGEPVAGFERRYDSKVGFCFFDSHHDQEYGPNEPGYDSSGCGDVDSRTFTMGMSPGWSDVYDFTLPGQEIDITDLPNGLYRFWARADPDGWFEEASEDNNLTWAIIGLSTFDVDGGGRLASVVEAGPSPEDLRVTREN
jgi:hypothetical protein